MSPKFKSKPDPLTGRARANLSRNFLPSEIDIVRYFRYQHEEQANSIGQSIQIAASEAVAIWNQVGLPHQLKRNVVRRVAKVIASWQRLKKVYMKKKSKPLSSLQLVIVRMSYFFNISANNIAEELRDSAERAKFWNQQMASKIPIKFPKTMTSGVPVVCKQCTGEKNDKKKKVIEKKPKRLNTEPSVNRTVREAIVNESTETQRRSKRLQPLTKAVIENLDRTRLSNRGAVGVLAATVVAVGVNPQKMSLSAATVQRKRKMARQEIAKKIRNEFPKDKALVVHFDSKQLVFNRKKTEKLAVVVTGLDSVDQIINSAFLESGTGQAVAEVVFESLQRWGLDGIISGKCYDTTNVNTGERNGAAVILERMLGRKLLDFPCRHHIYELVLMTAYKSCFNQATTSPDDILFKSFRNEWDRLDQLDYSGFPEGIFCEAERTILVEFCKRMLLKPFIREDYSELLELTLICLGDRDSVVIRRPGALHHARWMAKAIYGLKMYLFRKQILVDNNQLQRFVEFVVKVYVKGWYEALIATKAPLNDLQFMQTLKNYHDKELSEKTSKKFERHLWYLSELNISLSFFDDSVDDDLKRRMVKNLQQKSYGNLTRVKKFFVQKTLDKYVTKKSLQFFDILHLEHGFLYEADPNVWRFRSDYLAAKAKCSSLVVVNDPAERALGAAGEYNEFGPKTDQEKCNLLMAVAENRKKQNNSLKSSVTNYLAA